MKQWIEPERITTDARMMTRRLKKRPTLLEAFAVLLNLGFVLLFWGLDISNDTFEAGPDYRNYIAATHNDFSDYFYGYWLLPVFEVLGALPSFLGYLLFTTTAVMGVWIAVRIFGGCVPAAMLTYQMVFASFYGQITGIVAGALALFWWMTACRRWNLAGFFLLIACSKYHTAGLLALVLWLSADITWRERFRILVVPALISLLSLVVYPLWPLDVIETLRAVPPPSEGSIALWQWIGPLSLLIWLPVLLLPMSRGQRIIAVGSATALGLPYFQQADLLMLYTLPIGMLGLLGNVGFLYYWFTDLMLRVMVFIPVLMYLFVVLPSVRLWIRSHRVQVEASSE